MTISNHMNSISRRRFLATSIAAALPLARGIAATKPSLHAYDGYGWLRGFSVVPSWGARIEEAWWSYDGARMREEVAVARTVHANCIRLWIEFTAWMADPEKVTANFLNAVAAIAEAGMKTMPCLFNRWHDSQFDYGGTHIENLRGNLKPHVDYVRALVQPLAVDGRVLVWDLCNEPQGPARLGAADRAKEHGWLALIEKTVRECGAQQPITIGTMTGENIEAFADLGDVLCGHPYAHDRAGLEKQIASFSAMRQKFGKPLLVNECIPGSLSDATRAEVARFYSEALAAAGTGWMGWALREGKAISTRRDRYDGNGINKEGFHPFFTRDGKLRGGLDFLTQKPALQAPWENEKQ